MTNILAVYHYGHARRLANSSSEKGYTVNHSQRNLREPHVRQGGADEN